MVSFPTQARNVYNYICDGAPLCRPQWLFVFNEYNYETEYSNLDVVDLLDKLADERFPLRAEESSGESEGESEWVSPLPAAKRARTESEAS